MNAPQLFHHRHIEPGFAPGFRLAQLALARAIANKDRCNVLPITQELFPRDAEALAVARTATGAADTDTAEWAAALVQADTIAMLRSIEPISAAAKLAGAGTQVALNSDGPSARVPAVPLLDPSMEPAWCGEGGVMPVLKGAVAGQRLTGYKLAGIATLSQELERTSDAVEAMRQMLRLAASNMLDRSVFDNSPGVAFVRPAGLLYGVTLGTGTAGGGLAAMAADIAALYATFAAAGVGANVVFVVNSGTAAALSVTPLGAIGERIIGSPAVPTGTVVAVDAAYFVAAFAPIEVDLDGSSTLTLANADGVAPTQAMDAAGALGTEGEVLPDRGVHVKGGITGAATVGAQAVSMYQTWSLGVRLVWPVGFGMALPGAVQGLEGITWTDAPTP